MSAHSPSQSGTPARARVTPQDLHLSPAAAPQLADVLLRVKQIVGDRKTGIPALIPISRAKLFAEMAAGRFPKPDMRLGARTTLWKLSTITRFIAEQSANAQ